MAVVEREVGCVEIWQIVLMAFFVLLPMALLADFWPDRERLNFVGKPVERSWKSQIEHPPTDSH